MKSDRMWGGLPASVLGSPSWPDAIDDQRWQSLFGRPPRGVFVLIDDQVDKSHGQLRSLPLLRALGISRFTFANGWRGLDLVPYTWCRLAEDTDWATFDAHPPICQIVSQDMEDRSAGDVAYRLLQAHRQLQGEGLLILVLDTARFSRARDPQARSFIDEHELPMPIEYGRLAERFVKRYQLGGNQPLISMNLAWQGLASYRSNEAPIQHLPDLLDYARHRADSPIWGFYDELCRLGAGGDETERVRDTVRHWVDREVTSTTKAIGLGLQRVGYDSALLQLRRQGNGA